MFQITTYVCQTSSNVLTYPPKCVKRVQMFQITTYVCQTSSNVLTYPPPQVCETSSNVPTYTLRV